MLALYAGRSTPNRATESMLPPAAIRVSRLTIFRQVAATLRRSSSAVMFAASPADGSAKSMPFWMCRGRTDKLTYGIPRKECISTLSI